MQVGGLLLTQVYVLPNEKFGKHCHVENGWAWFWIRVLYCLWFFFSCDQFTASFIPFPAQSHVFPLTKKRKYCSMYKFQMERGKKTHTCIVAYFSGDKFSTDWDKAWSSFRKQGKKRLFSQFSPDKYVTWNPRRSNYPLSEEVDPIKRTERSNLMLWTSPGFTLTVAIIIVTFLLIYTILAPVKWSHLEPCFCLRYQGLCCKLQCCYKG